MRTHTIITSIGLLLVLLFAGCTGVKEKKPKNIIIFIGDGMGIAQVYAGMTVAGQNYNIERFPYSGFSKTYSADSYITDSAAGGTAIACGVKTNNGMIGMKPDSSIAASIIEIAHENGLSTGILSTSAVTHATPASFIAHNASRDNYEDIALDFLNGSIDFFAGGGLNHFRFRSDSTDLTQLLKKQGFDVVLSIGELKQSTSSKVAGLLAGEHMDPASAGRGGMLSAMTGKAIETLSKNRNGFVLMVEGSMIDWAAHEQNIDDLVSEMTDLDQAVGVAMNFALQNKETLVVITADHETGGLALNGGSITGKNVVADFSGGDHTAVMVPVFSMGPGAQEFSGIHENTFFLGEFIRLLNLKIGS